MRMLGLLPNEDTVWKRRWRPFLQDLAWSSFPHSDCLFCPQQGQPFSTLTVPLHSRDLHSLLFYLLALIFTTAILILTLKLCKHKRSLIPLPSLQLLPCRYRQAHHTNSSASEQTLSFNSYFLSVLTNIFILSAPLLGTASTLKSFLGSWLLSIDL